MWYFGFDGFLFIEWVVCLGYVGILVGENILEIFEIEFEILVVWMEESGLCIVIMDLIVIDMGFVWL